MSAAKGPTTCLGLDQQGFEEWFDRAYEAAATNVNLVVATGPLQVLLVTRPGLDAWPLWLLGLLSIAPAFAAAFEVVGDWGCPTRAAGPWRAFWSAWLRGLLPAGLLGMAVLLGLGVLLVDLRFALQVSVLQVTVVPVAVVAVGIILVGAGVLAGRTVVAARLVDHVRSQLWLIVRHPLLSLLTLVLLASLAAACVAWPIAAPLIVPSVLLYAVRANVAHALRTELRA